MRRAARSMAYTRGVAPYIPHCGGGLARGRRGEAEAHGGVIVSPAAEHAGSELPSVPGKGRRRSGEGSGSGSGVPLRLARRNIRTGFVIAGGLCLLGAFLFYLLSVGSQRSAQAVLAE